MIAMILTAQIVDLVFSLVSPAKALDPQNSISQFTHTSWSAKDGIPGPVRAIAQSPDGYLWLEAQAGLYRFDGLRFVLWQPDSGALVILCVNRQELERALTSSSYRWRVRFLQEENSELKRAEAALRRSEAYLTEAQRLSLTGSFG